MSEPRGAVLLAVGTELTEGVILNTHFRFLGSQLKSLGFRVVRGEQIPDDRSLFARSLRRAAGDAGLLLVTGGLGPTSDDLTREAVAEAAGVGLEFRPELWQALVERYAAAGQSLPAANRRQAFIPAGFEVLPNDRGTAPGFCGRLQEAFVACLPGPPAELEPMFARQVLPALAVSFPGLQTEELAGTVLLTPESALEEALAARSVPGVVWGTRVADDRIEFSLRGGDAPGRERVFTGLLEELGIVRLRRGSLGPAERLSRRLEADGLKLALAESCTGGLTAKLLTDLPGSSRVFWGGVTAYSNDAKERLLGVPRRLLEERGAVSREAAEAMGRGLLERSTADLSVAITGVAGPEGGSAEKPVGTVWVAALHRDGRAETRAFRFPGGRDLVRRRSAVAALLLAECLLEGWAFPAVFPP